VNGKNGVANVFNAIDLLHGRSTKVDHGNQQFENDLIIHSM
jgi:hypothetical protein